MKKIQSGAKETPNSSNNAPETSNSRDAPGPSNRSSRATIAQKKIPITRPVSPISKYEKVVISLKYSEPEIPKELSLEEKLKLDEHYEFFDDYGEMLKLWDEFEAFEAPENNESNRRAMGIDMELEDREDMDEEKMREEQEFYSGCRVSEDETKLLNMPMILERIMKIQERTKGFEFRYSENLVAEALEKRGKMLKNIVANPDSGVQNLVEPVDDGALIRCWLDGSSLMTDWNMEHEEVNKIDEMMRMVKHVRAVFIEEVEQRNAEETGDV